MQIAKWATPSIKHIIVESNIAVIPSRGRTCIYQTLEHLINKIYNRWKKKKDIVSWSYSIVTRLRHCFFPSFGQYTWSSSEYLHPNILHPIID